MPNPVSDEEDFYSSKGGSPPTAAKDNADQAYYSKGNPDKQPMNVSQGQQTQDLPRRRGGSAYVSGGFKGDSTLGLGTPKMIPTLQ